MEHKRLAGVALALAAAALALAATPAEAHHGNTTIESLSSTGANGNGPSGSPDITTDGRFLAFESGASNLVPGDVNFVWDIFVRDLDTGAVERVSVTSAGVAANRSSYRPSISDDGRFVVFESTATNLVVGDTNNTFDVFLHDRVTGDTTRISVGADGAQANWAAVDPEISGDGRFIVFNSPASTLIADDTITCAGFSAPSCSDVFRYDRLVGTMVAVSRSSSGLMGNSGSFSPSISADGRLVAFSSVASNLVGDDSNGKTDLFVRDVTTGTTSRVSRGDTGTNGPRNPDISHDGSRVAFESDATDLVPNDTNRNVDIFVTEVATGTTVRASLPSNGRDPGHNFSEQSWNPKLSPNGRTVSFTSSVARLVADDTNTCAWYDSPGQCPDVFVHDLTTSTTSRVTLTATGYEAQEQSGQGLTLDDGRALFVSNDDWMVANDRNATFDIFMHHPDTCLDGRSENGLASGTIHESGEALIDPYHQPLHDLSCDQVEPIGL